MQYLIVTSLNYADEFDMPGVSVISEEQMKYLKDNLTVQLNCSFVIGTNEEIEFKGTVETFLEQCTITEITDENYSFLRSAGLLNYMDYFGEDYIDSILDFLTEQEKKCNT